MTNHPQPPVTHPLPIGRRLLVVPLDFRDAVVGDRIPLRLVSSSVFGAGTHPTTQLCLLALERHLPAGATVADIGTGTGILAMAAAKLGASDILALDIDPTAILVARQNIVVNGLEQQIRLRPGSLAELLVEQAERGPVDVVIVNILAGVVEGLFDAGLATAVKPGGLLILSGLLPAQTAGIRACFRWHGLKLLAQEQREEWVCLLARRLHQPGL